MSEVRKWTKQQEATIQTITAQQDHCEKELGHAREEYEDLSARASGFNQNNLWPERLKELETMTRQTEEQLRAYYGSNFSHQQQQSAEADVRLYLEEYEHGLRQHGTRMRRQERDMTP